MLPGFREQFSPLIESPRNLDSQDMRGSPFSLHRDFGASLSIRDVGSRASASSHEDRTSQFSNHSGGSRSASWSMAPSPRMGVAGVGTRDDSSFVLSTSNLGKKRKPRTFRKPQVSDYCHICGRTSKTQKMSPCANIRVGTCQKAVCRICFEAYGWDWTRANDPAGGWPCCHCRKDCPPNSRCFVYQKSNEKRKQKSGSKQSSAPVTPR